MTLPDTILSLPAETASLVLLKAVPGDPPDEEELVALGATVAAYERSFGGREGAMAEALRVWFGVRIEQIVRFIEQADG